MKKLLSYLLVLSSCFSFLTQGVMAEDEIRNLQVDLKAKAYNQTQYFDNLESSSIIFSPASQIQLQLIVKNQGNRNQTNIKVTGKLPATVSASSTLVFTIPQVAANNDYVKNFILTVKDKTQINKILTKNDLSVSIKSDVGSQSSDSLYFYTSGGTKGVTASTSTPSSKPILPQTGPEGVLLGTLLSLSGAFLALKARKLARGY